ncbi:TOMM precursor leader peptide-binding protein [Haloechinothrix salitolerans]|uniref:TOMM leader peptide-binding protein n=1 Tax=Haloechinothrix salitolerans TaxID=926830 RepID=A0ABW2C774_9PSEU
MTVDTTATTTTAQPRSPRLIAGVSALRRGNTEVQIGLDPRHAVVIGNLPPVVARLLRSLDGTATVAALTKRAGRHAPVLRSVLDALTRRGLLTDARTIPDRPNAARHEAALWALRSGVAHDAFAQRLAQASIVVSGAGPITVAMAQLLAACGVGHVAAESAGKVTPSEIGISYRWDDVGRRKRDAIATAVSTANPTAATTPVPIDRGPDLLVLADTMVQPPHRVDQLMGERQPHLPVRFRDGVGVVGPLVFPGRTSCMRCADLHRTDLDSAWPRLAHQLIGRTGRADPASTHATAALAVGQIMRAVQDGGTHPPLWNATLELDLVTGDVTRRTWLPHPRCTCGAPPA